MAEVDSPVAGRGDLGQELHEPLACRLATGNGPSFHLGFELPHHIGRRPRPHVGEDQRLLEPLPRLGIESLEQAGAELRLERLAARGQTLS